MTIFLDIALNYNKELMKITSNEFRIGPKNTGNELKKQIEDIIRVRQYHNSEYYDWEKRLLGKNDPLYVIKNENIRKQELKLNDIFFVIHFFKRKDLLFQKNDGKKQKLETTILQQQRCRDHDLRITIKKHSEGIKQLREQYPEFAQIIRGIDAASSEIDARPEAFAQAFRFLKNHQIRENYSEIKGKIVNNRLNVTFHAGEDFFDLVDGLRYIDECLFFLNMEHGDRFGHAIALGIDVKKYYALKRYKLVLSKHTLLDNLAWLLSKVRKFGLGKHINEVYRLENIFKSLFSEIYLNSCDSNSFQHIHYQQYFDAWKLRGDNPEMYYDYFTNWKKKGVSIENYFENKKNITYWERCALNTSHYKLSSVRKREEIAKLYLEYHYNPKVKNKGFEMKQFEITDNYIQLVTDVQKEMMHFISKKNISIETNPTSNFLIGPIEKYIDHPILNWYNLGLETDPEKIKNSPQLSVSINTDDAGIFSTSLENEYALMAIALEKEKDEFGNPKYKPAMIYDWLDRIREMGLQQSFKNEH
jgi:adenosine deaminase